MQSNYTLDKPIALSSQRWEPYARPLVSICCMTYNHGRFIKDALNGFLGQRTTFPVEILVHDDASDDESPKIIQSYERQHPHIIKVIYQSENQYSQGIEPAGKFLFPRARGEYIALCEGDDYWIDPLKLQKQIGFMEMNREFSACFGGYSRLMEDTGEIEQVVVYRNSPAYSNGFAFSLRDMEQAWLTKTLTAVFRKKLLQDFDLSVYRHNRDIHLFYHLIKEYKAFYFSKSLGVYRVHEGGVNSMKQGKINKNAAYDCYRELYHANKDAYTRKMHLNTTLGLLNYNLFNNYKENRLRENARLFGEALTLIRSLRELKMLLMVFLKRQWKDKIKEEFLKIS